MSKYAKELRCLVSSLSLLVNVVVVVVFDSVQHLMVLDPDSEGEDGGLGLA
jgi:hypothetical protein